MNEFKNNRKGKYIVFEGGECCGKSTVMKELKKLYPEFLYIREPGGIKLSEDIRNMIFTTEHSCITEAYLFASARAEIIHNIVKPAIERGQTVISDRSVLSSIVYQGFTGELGPEKVWGINKPALDGLEIDTCLLFDITPETSIERISKRDNEGGEITRFDTKLIKVIKDRREAYLRLTELGFNVEIVDAGKEINIVIQSTIDKIEKIVK